MVRAIQEGRKTQTRRIVKPQPEGSTTWLSQADSTDCGFYPNNIRANPARLACPYGQPGDRLWVRETWAPMSTFDPSPETGAVYKADNHPSQSVIACKWKPSIHMFRWASRITLEITGVRVERLQDISNEDCVAEGITAIGKGVRMPDGRYAQSGRYETKASTVRQLYSELWESINGSESWAANPWVWVVEFRRCE
jgi:hypothetical protein